MPEPTLQQVFGNSATQDSTTITISKADLAGLTASASNTAESLFVGILLRAASYLTETNLQSNPDQSIFIESSFDSIVSRNNTSFRQKTYSINLQKIDTNTEVDPDDY